MKIQLARSLRNCFVAEMARRLPAFSPASGRSDVLSLKISSELYFFVHLSIDEDKDSFTLEVACNTLSEFPWSELPGQLRDLSISAKKNVWRFRISKLWGETKDFRWNFAQTASPFLSQVEVQTQDAVDIFCRYAGPYLEQVARNHGHPMQILARSM